VELSDLTAYAEEKFHIHEQHKWSDTPGFSVLNDPNTGKPVVILMRQWDYDTGTQIERCDIKCGMLSPDELSVPYLTTPFRMKGNNWVGVILDSCTDSEMVCQLLDRAINPNTQSVFTIVLEDKPLANIPIIRASMLPVAGERQPIADNEIPSIIRDMLQLYEFRSGSFQMKCKNFYHQGKLMEHYEDDKPWSGDWRHYFPTYHDMTIRQLRGYFTWRTHVRRGDYQPIAASFAYVYLYELLNGIGVDSPEESLLKMQEFEASFLNTGIGDPEIRKYLRRWMLEFIVLHSLPVETALLCADPSMLSRDQALAALKSPAKHTDEAVFSALCTFSDQKAAVSPVINKYPERGKHLFSEVWRAAAADGLFTTVFGEQKLFAWHPLSNAVVWDQSKSPDTNYILNECHSYRCRNGVWHEARFDGLYFDRDKLRALMHETDRQLRIYLKTGHHLREKAGEAWAGAYVSAVIASDREAQLEAMRPKLIIDLSGLDKIRRDASTTRDSLLTEEERIELAEISEQESYAAPAENPMASMASVSILNALQTQIVAALLHGESAKDLLASNHLMPSIVADAINEALFDEIGDTCLECDGSTIFIVEDYREDLEQILGGNADE